LNLLMGLLSSNSVRRLFSVTFFLGGCKSGGHSLKG
jgi:hypothetical protein